MSSVAPFPEPLPLLSALPDSRRVWRLYQQVLRSRRNCAFDDLENLLRAVGFSERKAAGSHRIFKLGGVVLTIPQRKPVKENYVDQVITILQERGVTEAGATDEDIIK